MTKPLYIVQKTTLDYTLNEIFKQFQEELHRRKYDMENAMAYKFVCLLACDARYGLLGVEPTICSKKLFFQKLLLTLDNHLSPTLNNFKLSFYFKKTQEIDFDYVKEKYDKEFKKKLKVIIDDILQFPETSLPNQIDDMTYKMLVFIIACYNLGSPKNHVLLKQTKQSLDSIIGRSDLRDYVLKKKYHRTEYLERLGSIVAGIIIYNNYDEAGEKENLRDLFADLDLALSTTRTLLETAHKTITKYKQFGKHFLEKNIEIDVPQRKVFCKIVIDRSREINNYVILCLVYLKCLNKVIEKFERTEYLISVARKKMHCVFEKLNSLVQIRNNVHSQTIFPHFVYLAEVWTTLVNYLNYLVELNKIKENMDSYLTDEMQNYYIALVEQANAKIATVQKPIEYTFDELIQRNTKTMVNYDMLKLSTFSKNYCTLTMALTSGLLVAANIEKKLCENHKFTFGFRNIANAKYAERYFEDYLLIFKNAVYTSIDLLLLFDLEGEVLKKMFIEDNCELMRRCRRINRNTQTEMVVTNDLSEKNWINVTWNKWDYHRETIHLANIRKLQTKTVQTKNSFGVRNAKQQYYNIRAHKEWNG